MTAEADIGFYEHLLEPSFLPTMAQIISAFVAPDGQDDNDAWVKFVSNSNKYYDILNLEYINTLADYLSSRAKELGAKPQKPITILEVGAGNGRLAHFLRQRLNPDSIIYIASDSEIGEIKHLFEDEPMAPMDYKDALQTYHPGIVICEWMPNKEDWTADFRKTPSVKEYILIGETNSGCCGHPWETWGQVISSINTELEYQIPPYIGDEFKRVNLRGDEWDHLCKSDLSPLMPYHSETVSFRRNNLPTYPHQVCRR